MAIGRSFHAVTFDLIKDKGADINALVDASVHNPNPDMNTYMRSVRGKKRPRNDQATAEYIAEQLSLCAEEKTAYFDALGLLNIQKTARAPQPLDLRVLDRSSRLADSKLNEAWDKAFHSGTMLAVALRRAGIVADTQGIGALIKQLDDFGLYDSSNIRERYVVHATIQQWVKGTPPDGLSEPDSKSRALLDAIAEIIEPQLEDAKRDQIITKATQDLHRIAQRGDGPVWKASWGRKAPLPPLKKLPASDISAPKRVEAQELADYIDRYSQAMRDKLKPEQMDTLVDVTNDLRAGNVGGVVKRPTGTGKTVMFSTIVAALKPLAEALENETGEQNSVLVLVPSNVLEHQTLDTILTKRTKDGKPFFHDPSNPDTFAVTKDDIAVYSDQNTDRQKAESLTKPVVIMTYAAYESQLNRGLFDPKRFLYTVIDEVDMAKDASQAIDKRTEKVRKITKNGFSSGWSATTKYVSVQHGPGDVSEVLYDRSDYIHNTRIRNAAENKEVSPVKNVVMVTGLNTESEVDNQFDYDENKVGQLINIPGRDEAVIERILSHVDEETGIAFKDLDQIWFCRGIEHSKRIASKLNDAMGTQQQSMDRDHLRARIDKGETPVFAMSVDGKMPDYDWKDAEGNKRMGRMEILQLHREGKIPVVCNADLLIRGYDSPRTQLAVMTYPSMSDAKVEQIGGRIGRIDPDNPDKLGFVVNVLDRDTQKGRVFSDEAIAESGFIGRDNGKTYQARRIRDGEAEKQPNFSVFQERQSEGPGIHIPESHVISGDAVKGFIEDYRAGVWEPSLCVNEDVPSDSPATQVTEPTMAAAKSFPASAQSAQR